MIKKTYIVSSSRPMAQRYCRENNNIGYVPMTIHGLVMELYNHPAFLMSNKEVCVLNHHQEDLRLCNIHKELDESNYFFEAMKIRGNRKLIIAGLQELKLCLKDRPIDGLKLEDKLKATSLVDIYKRYQEEDIFDYSKILFTTISRLEKGDYDSILDTLQIIFLDEFEIVGHENTFIELLKSKIKTLNNSINSHELGFSKAECSAVITKIGNIRSIFKWMHQNEMTNVDTKIIALNYDDYSFEFYQMRDKFPVYLEKGVKCLNFDFYEKFMTTLSTMSKTYQGHTIFLDKLVGMVKLRAQDKDKDELYRIFYSKVLNLVLDLKDAITKYIELDVPIDPYEVISHEVVGLRFTASELELDSSGLSLCALEDCYALENKNVAILGLSHGNYPKRPRLDPLLKKQERVDINKTIEAVISIEEFRIENMLDQLLQANNGISLLTYESHNVETGKLIVPSVFFNKILKSRKIEVKIENIFELCNVKESYVDELVDQDLFLEVYPNTKLKKEINTQQQKLYSDEIEDIDYGVCDSFQKDLSASSLEDFYKCPYMFNLRSNLEVYPADLGEVDKSYWLSATERGTFLHAAYESLLTFFLSGDESYTTFLKKAGAKEIQKAIKLALNTRVNRKEELVFDEYNLDVAEYIRKKEIEEMTDNLKMFLKKEQENEDGFYPFRLEDEFEYSWKIDGVELSFRGIIDRVDTDGKGNYRVVDYKTGRNYFKSEKEYLFDVYDKKYKNHKVYFQHVLYTKALLESDYKDDIKSIDAGYYFTSEKGQWAKVYHSGDAPEKKFKKILKAYITEAKAGKYYKNGTQCTWCDYKQICANKPEKRKHVSIPQIENLEQAIREEK